MIMKILLVLLPYMVNCANILVLEPVPSPSHHVWMKTLTYALASKGHNITAISADIEEDTPENLHYLHLDKVYEVLYDGSDDMNYVELGKANGFIKTLVFVTFSMRSLEGSVISKGYKQLLDYPDDFKFDLIIYDFVLGPLLLPFATKFPSTPIIGATAYSSSGFSIPVLGGTFTPAFIPYIFYSSELQTFQDRMNNFVFTFLDYLLRMYYITPRIHKAMGHDFPHLKDVRELDKTLKLVLINKDPVLSIQEQSLPNVISVGGMQIQRANALPKDLQTILDEAKKGVILFSLGTNIMGSMVKSERFTEILEAFRSLSEYTIIFKMDPEKIPGRLPSNVVVRSWLPQNDILAHPNLKLFITHCGLLSVQEALWHGVPMLGIPIFADGFDNIRLLAKQGIAEQQDIMQIERHSLQQVMKKILDDPKYWNNAQALSRIFKDQKETPLERAIWWTEFVLRNPNSTHMRSQSLDQGVFIRHSWDVLAFFSALFLIFLFCISKLVCLIFRRIAKKESAKKKRE
ncbi:UDP-glycosyltransferase UGT5-like [Phlebotomus argentipes]|uniref:UDP-glycosyltransferase UGT5-like n=1 Tax=Phlebotomus argentipes TaxID=94469 RepID=UPI002892E631|nr:UDP-glycosyltransferase UGT5-like [Phlebotomus argentipes]